MRAHKAGKAPKPKERKYWLKDAIKADMALPLRARIIGADLAELCDINEECAFPSHAGLMKRNGLGSLDTVKRAIVDLERAGYYAREMGAGSIGQNKYRPQWEKIGLRDSAMRQRFAALPGERLSPGSEGGDAPTGSAAVHPGGVQPCTGGECNDALGGSAALHPIRPAEDHGENQKEHQQRMHAHARDAAAADVSLDEGDRPSRGGSAREPVMPLPGDFAFDPVDVEAAITRGHTPESVAVAGVKFRKHFADRRKTLAQWQDAGRKWIGEERPPQPERQDPNEIVRVGDIMLGGRTCKRSEVKRWEPYTDAKGVMHPAKMKKPTGGLGTTMSL